MIRSFTEDSVDLMLLEHTKKAELHERLTGKWKSQPELSYFKVQIEDIDMFPKRLILALKRQKVNNVQDLLSLAYKDLIVLPNIGKKSYHLILVFLTQMTHKMFV
ncbi:DNA-directed RNA polymerase subunit alpha C-terminal domain-containing protein [Mucilaginibacter aquatilis]|uniref:RNA polymerase alpha subunit C-terminal domain-containing protein n=1 Tax=Mucilaginibacter aquatilis TaxID=1517760 RepID=A0A6I4ICD8_9SPHI|nr:DNA-directed RNA polymerase subunit alpha C-terminal domain-containing protein [Mucilaginibacter aquatilis]MVN92812.1 hypothetical protein [Mucilaginibacter aquatilis]